MGDNAQQRKIRTWRQIAAFYALALVLGTGTIFLIVQGAIPSSLVLVSGLSASIAGITMTAIVDGRADLKMMLGRLLIWRVGIGYWLFALFFIVPVIISGSLINPVFNGDLIDLSDTQLSFNFLPLFIVFVVLAGVGQELGWTGFLVPRLQGQVNALTSSIIRAALVATWHIPVFIYSTLTPDSMDVLPYGDWIQQQGFLMAFLVAVLLFIIPWSIFISWMFNNTQGSLLLVSILHGSEIWVVYWMMNTGIKPNNLDNYWGYGVVMVLVAVVFVAVSGAANLSRRQKRVIYLPTEN